MATLNFFRHPLRVSQYWLHEYPSYTWSLIFGFSGPIYALGVKPAYEYVRGIQVNEKVDYPSQYQLPNRERVPVPSTYDDPE